MPDTIITEKKGMYEIEMTVAGFTTENLTISGKKNLITVKGVCNDDNGKNERYYLIENMRADFCRSIFFPVNIDIPYISANINNGLLKIRLPKVKEKQEEIIYVNNVGITELTASNQT